MGYNTWIFSITGKYPFEVTPLSPAGIMLLGYCMVLAAGSKKWTLKERTILNKNSIINKIVKEFTKGKYFSMLTGVLDLCCWEFCSGVSAVGVKSTHYLCNPSIPPKSSHGFAVYSWHVMHGFGLWEKWRHEKSMQNRRKSQTVLHLCQLQHYQAHVHAKWFLSVAIAAGSERLMK